MSVRLHLLGPPTWDGSPLVGARPQALLAALVLEPRGLTVGHLVEQVVAELLDEPGGPDGGLRVG